MLLCKPSLSSQEETGPGQYQLTADSSCGNTIKDYSDFCDLLAAARRSLETSRVDDVNRREGDKSR